MTAAEIRKKMDELEARVNPDCIGSYISIFEVISESDLRDLLNDLAAAEERVEVLAKDIRTRDEILDDCGNKLVAYRERAEDEKLHRMAAEDVLGGCKQQLAMAQAERDRLRPLAIGGDGSTHWYWKDEAERLAEELKEVRQRLAVSCQEHPLEYLNRIERRQQHGEAK